MTELQSQRDVHVVKRVKGKRWWEKTNAVATFSPVSPFPSCLCMVLAEMK